MSQESLQNQAYEKIITGLNVGGSATPGSAPPSTSTQISGVARDDGTKTTRTDGTASNLTTDLQENQWVHESYAPLYEDNVVGRAIVEQRNTANYISTATTTTVKTGSGFLHKIVVEGGTTGTIIVYDNTAGSGTILASFDSTAALASYEFNVTFSTGLTIVTSAATKLTAVYR